MLRDFPVMWFVTCYVISMDWKNSKHMAAQMLSWVKLKIKKFQSCLKDALLYIFFMSFVYMNMLRKNISPLYFKSTLGNSICFKWNRTLFKVRDFKNKLFLIEYLNNNCNQISDNCCSKEIIWYVERARDREIQPKLLY